MGVITMISKNQTEGQAEHTQPKKVSFQERTVQIPSDPTPAPRDPETSPNASAPVYPVLFDRVKQAQLADQPDLVSPRIHDRDLEQQLFRMESEMRNLDKEILNVENQVQELDNDDNR